MRKLTLCLWFNTQAEEAANFYASVFDSAAIHSVTHYGPDQPMPEGTVLTITLALEDMELMLLNGGPIFPQTEAASIIVNCKDQAEIDHYWDALLAGGGTESVCGWLKDKYGVSWQVSPAKAEEWLTDPDLEKRNRFMQAMMKMVKLDIAELERAFEGS
jgi:predicted 3-demethylubiquinone-9 3-methyltransferase (glyoxalase superfamily)